MAIKKKSLTVKEFEKIVYGVKEQKEIAARKPVTEHFHTVCPEIERRVSLICAEGFKEYADTDDKVKHAEISTAWTKRLTVANVLKHARRHFNLYNRGDRKEDHMAKVIWSFGWLMHQESLQTDNPCQHVEMLIADTQFYSHNQGD